MATWPPSEKVASWPHPEKVVSMSFHAGGGEIATLFGRRHSSYLYEMQTAFFGSQLAFFTGGGQSPLCQGVASWPRFQCRENHTFFFVHLLSLRRVKYVSKKG